MTDPNGFKFTDYGGDDLHLNVHDNDTVLIETTDLVVLEREDVRALVVWLHQWLGDADVTGLDKPPGSEWLPTRADHVTRCPFTSRAGDRCMLITHDETMAHTTQAGNR